MGGFGDITGLVPFGEKYQAAHPRFSSSTLWNIYFLLQPFYSPPQPSCTSYLSRNFFTTWRLPLPTSPFCSSPCPSISETFTTRLTFDQLLVRRCNDILFFTLDHVARRCVRRFGNVPALSVTFQGGFGTKGKSRISTRLRRPESKHAPSCLYLF